MGVRSEDDFHAVTNKAFFDRWARNYDKGRLSRWFQYTQRLTIDLMDDLSPRSKVLDVGCGTGFAVHFLGTILREGKACGIDISGEMVARARAKTSKDIERRVEFKVASSDNLPYEFNEFDHVICTNSFHHYPDPLRSLKEMKRVLKPGGQLLILDNAVDASVYTWLWDRVLRMVERGHVRYYRTDELGGMLAEAGFENAALRYLKSETLKHGKLFASLMVWSGRKPKEECRKWYLRDVMRVLQGEHSSPDATHA